MVGPMPQRHQTGIGTGQVVDDLVRRDVGHHVQPLPHPEAVRQGAQPGHVRVAVRGDQGQMDAGQRGQGAHRKVHAARRRQTAGVRSKGSSARTPAHSAGTAPARPDPTGGALSTTTGRSVSRRSARNRSASSPETVTTASAVGTSSAIIPPTIRRRSRPRSPPHRGPRWLR